MKRRLLFAIVLVTTLVLTACGAKEAAVETAIPTVPAAYAGRTMPAGTDAAAGAVLFADNCVTCHGKGGLGDGPGGVGLPTRPRNLVTFAPQVGDNYLFWRISTGKPGTSMVAWNGIFSEEEIWQLVAFIRTLQ